MLVLTNSGINYYIDDNTKPIPKYITIEAALDEKFNPTEIFEKIHKSNSPEFLDLITDEKYYDDI